MDRLPAIESWHNTLTRTERMRLNHLSTVWRKWKAATAERETVRQAAPSGWGGAIETLIAAKREGAFLKMTDVNAVLSAAPYRRRDLTDLATVLSNLATYWKRNKKKIRAISSQPRPTLAKRCWGYSIRCRASRLSIGSDNSCSRNQ
jgi:hypothetical protein